MTATPNFLFRNASTSRGLISSGEGSAEFYHPLLPSTFHAVAGFLLILNGWNLNRCQSDIVGYDGTAATAVHLLQMRAPREPISPLVSWPGSGRIFRPGAKFRYRWRDSRTGEASGLSPIPDFSMDLGIETPTGGTTFLGVSVWFNISTTNKPASADTIDLMANSSDEDDVWYVVDSQPTGSSSYVLLSSNATDDEIVLNEAVVVNTPSAVPAGPDWSVGIMPPIAKAWTHPSGRTFFFGVRRFGVFRNWNCTAAVSQGSDLLTITASSTAYQQVIEPGRIGQRVRFFNTGSLTDPFLDQTVYRIVKVESANTVRVWPELQISTGLAAGGTANLYFSIEDDRDARWTQMSEPGKPWLVDPLKVLAAGDDYDDGVMGWFAYKGEIFMQTKRRIYQAYNSETDDPSRSTQFLPVVEEGTPGFYSGCITPFGYVYWHETRGVRLFLGTYSMPLTGAFHHGLQGNLLPEELPFVEFPPKTQFDNVDPGSMEDVHVCYDPEHRTILVSYIPVGSSGFRETMVFSTFDHVWRGPYREGITASGYLRATGSSNIFVTGDEFGELKIRESQVLDTTPALSGFSGTGTIASTSSNRVFTDSSAHFNQDGDKRLRGSPIVFYNTTTYWIGRIADVLSDTQLELDGLPVSWDDGASSLLVPGWTYSIGSILWSAVMAYLDAPPGPDGPAALICPVEYHKLNLRFARGAASETFESALADDASGVYKGVHTSGASTNTTTPTRDVNGKVHGEMRLQRESATTVLRLRGKSRNGDPKITGLVLEGTERPDGALKP